MHLASLYGVLVSYRSISHLCIEKDRLLSGSIVIQETDCQKGHCQRLTLRVEAESLRVKPSPKEETESPDTT